MATDDGNGLEKFFRCPLCKLPHEASTTTCPLTGRPVVAPRRAKREGAAPAARTGAARPDPAALQAAALPIGPGHLLDRKYLLGAQLGKGGMGVVYEATHVLLSRTVAVKLLRVDGNLDASFESRFLKEGRNLASVAHPHVVNVFDFGVASGVQYLVMERLEGESLEARIDRQGALDVPAASRIARQILSGLAAAHARGIVHRDLKPANVFLVKSDDDEIHVKLIDFGISAQTSKAESDPRVTGTPGYLPPEQARGEPADVRADIYSFGATMYETLTGRPPLVVDGLANLLAAIQLEAPEPPSKWRPGLPPELDRVILRALSKKPEDRFASAEEVLAQWIDRAPRPAEAPRYILVADANVEAGEVCRRAAKALRRAVVVVRDGLDALEITKDKGLPELLVASLSLPRMDGLALLTELRKAPGGEAMRAVVASRFPSIRASTWSSKDALGLSSVLAGLTDEGDVRRAMRDALQGKTGDEPPATSRRGANKSGDDAPATSRRGANKTGDEPPATSRRGANKTGDEPPATSRRGAKKRRPDKARSARPPLDGATEARSTPNPEISIWEEETRDAGPLPTLSSDDDEPISISADRELDVNDTDPKRSVIVLDADRRVAQLSAGFTALFGLRPESVTGLLREDLVRCLSSSFADPAAYLRQVLVLPRGPFAAHAVLKMRPTSGTDAPRTVRWYAKPKRTASGVEHVEVYQEAPK